MSEVKTESTVGSSGMVPLYLLELRVELRQPQVLQVERVADIVGPWYSASKYTTDVGI